ncbi:hypothetical protein CHS0354_000835 [Potamilus streckersoni]|uniref:SIMPL domain-containing protein n=1 Tax=Potamilus streckersoni TaxID=2493646 RepID=A0AAE0T7A7_9BIVA|nr:hypothetical protein CHS0354_000835 [Potamilus streckersoni]
MADLVVWPMSIRLAGDDLKGMQHTMNGMVERVKIFLKDNGFEDSEITLSVPEIRDNFAFSSPQTKSYRFFIRLRMVLRTNKVKQVLLAVNKTVELVGYGIVLSEEYDAKPTFLFTKLNEIKPEMIKEATLNARAAAEQFAMDSGVNVGNIQQATQGFFTVEDRDLGSPQFKNIRVVTNVNYYLSN